MQQSKLKLKNIVRNHFRLVRMCQFGAGRLSVFDFRANRESGAVMMIAVIFFIVVSSTIILGLTAPVARDYRVADSSISAKQSYYIAESGTEDAYYRLKTGKQTSASETLVLGSSSTTTTITDLASGQKQISGLGTYADRERTINMKITAGEGVAFNYGMQVGTGGLVMSNSATINGNVYVNGNITGNNSAQITGAAIAADRTAEVIDQVNDTGTPTNTINFGTATATQDAGQSFTVATSDTITQVAFYIKKVGSPSNATVRITTDASGKPATSSLATGTLSASGVTTSYGWATVVLSPNVTLATGTTYWLVIDAGTSASNYYIWGANNAGYANGLGKTGQYGTSTWNNTSPSGLDAFFKIYLGGINSTISGMTIGGTAWAHTVTGSTITGTLSCQTGSGNNKACTTTSGDPEPLNFPVSDAQITDWKTDALAGGVTTGNYSISGSTTASLGPRKIVGNLYVSNNAILTISGTVWVTGNIVLSNSAQVRLSSSYGTSSGIVIADGTVSTSNSAVFAGSGSTGSYMMMLTTSSSSSAINIANSAGTVILVAPNGTITFSNSAGAKEAIAKTISMSNSATLTYESGLANVNFSSGPSGAYSIDSWREQ